MGASLPLPPKWGKGVGGMRGPTRRTDMKPPTERTAYTVGRSLRQKYGRAGENLLDPHRPWLLSSSTTYAAVGGKSAGSGTIRAIRQRRKRSRSISVELSSSGSIGGSVSSCGLIPRMWPQRVQVWA